VLTPDIAKKSATVIVTLDGAATKLPEAAAMAVAISRLVFTQFGRSELCEIFDHGDALCYGGLSQCAPQQSCKNM